MERLYPLTPGRLGGNGFLHGGTDQDGRRASASLASKKPEFELVRRTLGQVGQRRMSVEADPGWRIVAAASVASIYRTLQVRFILPHLAMWLKNRVDSV